MATQMVERDENFELNLARAALARELKQWREQKIDIVMQEATNDPLFIQDLEECMRNFAELDRDSLQYIDFEPDYEL